MCTDGYVPYGWQFEDENIYIPSKKAAKLNIFGMITKKIIYNKRIHQCRQAYGLSWQVLSFELKKKTVIILDNASVHRNRKIKEQRKIWKDRGLFLFYLPYSPELNSSETLWRILKGKWIRPVKYNTKTRFSIV